MKTSKAVQILSVLSDPEVKELDNFINSPYFNSNGNIIKLFGLLKKQYPELDAGKIEKKTIFSKLFPGKAYNEQIMKNLSSRLLQLTLEFLGINKYRNRSINDRELDILSELNIKRLDNIYTSRLKKIENDLTDSTNMIHPLFYHLHRVETIKTQYLLSRDKQKLAADNVMKAGEYLIYYFITELTRSAIDLNANIAAFNVVHDTNLVYEVLDNMNFGHIINYLKENNYKYSNIIDIYYNRLLAMLDSSDERFYSFKKKILDNAGQLSIYELGSLLDSLHNIAIQRINDGLESARGDEFEVIKLKLKYNTIDLRTGGTISLLHFRNVIFTSVKLNQLSWGEEFLEKFIHKVNKDTRESAYNHAKGIFAYVKKDFDNAIMYLNRVELENPYLASDVKSHIAIIYFEQGHYESCISVLDSFRHIVTSRDVFSLLFKEVNLRFINATNSMIKAKSSIKKTEILDKVIEKLNAHKMVNHKSWLLKKANEMMAEK
jgi:hypothetical protein